MELPTKELFDQHVKDLFNISFVDDNPSPCQIKEVKAGLQPTNAQQKEQYSVVFACDNPEIFEQGVYKVSHSKMGKFELFLVPIFGDDKGVHYEAVFT